MASIEKQLLLSFRPDISLAELPDGGVELRGYQLNIPLRKLPAGMSAVFQQLCVGGGTERELLALAMEQDGAGAMMYFYQYLGRLANLLCHTLREGERPFLTLNPQTFPSTYRFQSNLVDLAQSYTLSRFAYLRQEQGHLVLESPLGQVKLLLHDGRAAAWISALAQPQTAETLPQYLPDLSPNFAGMFLNFLLNAQALFPTEADCRSQETCQETLAQWDFHDLLFHSRSRLGRHNNPYGGTYRAKGKFTPLPVVKPPMSSEVIHLNKPDLELLKQEDMPFTAVLESRRSIRQYGEHPLTSGQLGEFLYRTARIQQMYQGNGSEEGVSFRPYPAGGAVHELEIYPIVAQCQELPAGLYHYDPLHHQLHRLAEKNKQVDTLLHMAWLTANQESPLQVCLAITARFQRVQWKYESMAYALILKHVGVLYQTMYLVATAMGLAPCALGGGNSDLFATAAGLDYYAETTVGEFLLGSRPDLGELKGTQKVISHS